MPRLPPETTSVRSVNVDMGLLGRSELTPFIDATWILQNWN
jgi:hypothetical protein